MAEIHGRWERGFDAVRDALAASLDAEDVGASAAVFIDGEPMVDIWGGYVDANRTVAWQQDTIVNVWSTTKTMAALCALILADRGELDLDAPVARYWPEFAAAGKQAVLVRHVLSHTAGLPTWDEPMTVDDLYDWTTATTRLAGQVPRWEPGTAAGYHAVTQGYLIGEVVRRITGRGLGEFFAADVAGPLAADFHIGLSAAHDSRVAPVIPPPSTPFADRVAAGRFPANPVVRPEDGNTVAWRRAGIPSAGGFGNARSVAAVQSVLACGGAVRGVRLLSEAGCAAAWREQYGGEDLVLSAKMRYSIGYGMFGSRTVGWGGAGGSLVMVDPDSRMAVSYVMNQMLDHGSVGDDRGLAILMAAYDGLASRP
jgi:CubicO group peptidase (beta-lactamase class C family)